MIISQIPLIFSCIRFLLTISFSIGPPDCIYFPIRADEFKFLLVDHYSCVDVNESIVGRRLSNYPFLSSTAHYALLISLKWFARWQASGRKASVLWGTASRRSLKLHTSSSWNYHLGVCTRVHLRARVCVLY